MKRNYMQRLALAGAFLAMSSAPAWATNDPTVLYTGLQTPFDAAVGVVIGMIGVLLVIRWIKKGLRA